VISILRIFRYAIALLCAPVLAHAQDVIVPADSVSLPGTEVPRRDVMDIVRGVLGREVEQEPIELRPGLSFSFLPSIGYNPAYGTYAGMSVAIGGWLGDPKTTTISSGSAGVTYSTTGQLSVQFKSDFFAPENKWDFKSDWRYLDTSQETFGLGPVEAGKSAYPMDFVMLRFFETAYRRIHQTSFYVGLGYHFNRYQDIVDERADQGEITPFIAYERGYPRKTTSSGFSANVLYESRDNPINATQGLYWNASFRVFDEGLGSDDNYQQFWSDLRVYPHIPKGGRNVLGFWSYMWLTFGHAPYLDLPSVGWDTYGRGGRGYVQGRIRGESQIYNEVEYRVPLTADELLGAVGFFGLMVTTAEGGSAFSRADPSGGVGLRLKFNKRTATNLTADLGWGRDQPARLFLGMQEAF
jgi:outer membrane protein assembly factor BamA